MYTYQDFEKAIAQNGLNAAVSNVIQNHVASEDYKIAKTADLYDRQKNETINKYVKMIFSLTGMPIEDFTASNNKIASNFFHRLNTQRCTYLLGNGVTFVDDGVKDRLGDSFDTTLKNVAYYALIHGVSFGFWDVDTLHLFKLTEFAPLWDEATGALRAGVRFWRIDAEKPLYAVLYEEDGITKFKAETGTAVQEYKPKTAYKTKVVKTEADGEEVVGEENYTYMPIVPMYGSRLKQSTLIGMQQAIDSFDLIRSGFANDLTDCAQIYWIIENCGGMNTAELANFRNRLKLNHIAVADTDNGKVTPYAQDIPNEARKVYLEQIRSGIYEDFGALDVHELSATSTNDHIDAAYQPMDEEADDLEFQVITFLQNILGLMGIQSMPVFKRNRISNEAERTQMVISAAQYLDEQTLLEKLPFITVDEVEKIMKANAVENANRYTDEQLEGMND